MSKHLTDCRFCTITPTPPPDDRGRESTDTLPIVSRRRLHRVYTVHSKDSEASLTLIATAPLECKLGQQLNSKRAGPNISHRDLPEERKTQSISGDTGRQRSLLQECIRNTVSCVLFDQLPAAQSCLSFVLSLRCFTHSGSRSPQLHVEELRGLERQPERQSMHALASLGQGQHWRGQVHVLILSFG